MKRKIFQTGGIIALMITMTACGNQAQAETVEPTTVVETTIQETTAEPTTEESDEEGGFTGKTEDGEVIASMGRYGEYGKEMYDLIVSMWLSNELETEEDLRLNARELLGSISEENYEAIITEILAMDRGTTPNVSIQQTEPAVNQKEAQPVAETQPQVQPTQPSQPEQELAPGALSKEEVDRREREAGMAPHPDVEVVDPKGAGGGSGEPWGVKWN